MMNEHQSFRSPILDGKNYNNWKFAIEIILTTEELNHYVYGQVPIDWKPDLKKENQAKCLIISTLDNDHLTKVVGCSSARDIWNTIACEYEVKSTRADLRIISLKRIDLNTFRLSLQLHLIDTNMKVYRANPIPHYINVTTNPTKVNYIGNHFMVRNITNNCFKAIDEPLSDLIVSSCHSDESIDLNLDKWEPIDCNDINTCRKSTIKLSTEHTYIQCLFNEITIDNSTMKCPHYPFRLPITTPFSLNDYHHKVNSKMMQIHEELPNDIMVRIHNSSELEDTNKQLELIESL